MNDPRPTPSVRDALKAEPQPPVGVVLIQLGTPDSTSVSDVRSYLREFLSDPRVMDMPSVVRFLLLNLVILPFRPQRSAKQYREIWTEPTSPLLRHTVDLAEAVQEHLGSEYLVTVGMRYKNPPLAAALDQLAAAGCTRVVAVPLFPQYASASYGSAAAKVLELAARRWNVPAVSTVPPFFGEPGFLEATAAVARPLLDDFAPEHILFSYHGVPESHLRRNESAGARGIEASRSITEDGHDRFCYRAQCYATTSGLVDVLGLPPDSYSTTFQSRMAGQKWIRPYTDHAIQDLRDSGVRRLAVLTPSFVADCLETLEEIGVRLRRQWREFGGEELLLIPCLNAAPAWSNAVADLVRTAT